jgi:hypothetical protein
MYYSDQNKLTLIVPLALLGTFALAYLVIGKDMSMVFNVLIGAFLLFVCFMSIRLSLILLIFSMLLSPEIVVGSTTSRDVTIRGEDLFLMCMTMGWLCRIAIFKDVGFTRKSPINKAIFAYCAIAILSTTLGVIRGDVKILAGFFFVLKMIEYFVLFFLVLNYLEDEKEIHALLTIMLLVWGIVTVYGLFQAVTGGDIAAPFEGSRAEKNTLSGYLVLLGSIAGGLLIRNEKAGENKWLLLLLAAAFVVLLLSVSRSGWIAGLTAFLILFLNSKKKGNIVLLICIVVLIFPFFIPEAVLQRLEFTFHQHSDYAAQVKLGGLKLDTSTSARFFDYLLVLRKFVNHPLMGYGITGFSFLDGQFFRTLAEMGLMGFCALIWLFVTVHNSILRAVRELKTPRLGGLALGMYAGFWAMMVHAISANTFIIVRICEPFWCLMGLTILAYDFQKDREEVEEEPEPVTLQEKLLARKQRFRRV